MDAEQQSIVAGRELRDQGTIFCWPSQIHFSPTVALIVYALTNPDLASGSELQTLGSGL